MPEHAAPMNRPSKPHRASTDAIKPVPLSASVEQIERLLSVISDEVLPLTRQGVLEGNKVFGAAVLDARNWSTVLAGTNHETLCPLYHGEIWTIMEWANARREALATEQSTAFLKNTEPFSETAVPSKSLTRHFPPPPADSIFLSTHEPCCMCISAIVWAGFTKVFYLFPYETTKEQGIPHDIDILQELWMVDRYSTSNKFCSTAGIANLIEQVSANDDTKDMLRKKIDVISHAYDELSSSYHSRKSGLKMSSMISFI